MSTIVTRAGKGSPLTNNEMDSNLTNLNTDKIETAMIVAATSKATPVDADLLALVDSAASNTLKKLTWANVKATLKTYFDTLYAAASVYIAYLNVAQVFTKPQTAQAFSLTSSSAVDASTYQSWVAPVNGSTFTVSNPTGGITSTYYTLYITYTTSNTVSFGTNFKGVSNFIPTATAGAEDHLTFRFDGTYYECTGYATNIKA